MHTSEVTRAAGDHDVVEIVRAAAGMRHKVVVLSLHGLECRMLVDVPSAPRQRVGINCEIFSDEKTTYIRCG
jgi:hypothetical protein